MTRVTPGRSATSGSTSWGRARSTTARRPLPPGHHLGGHEHARRAGAGDHEVGRGHLGGQPGERRGADAVLGGEAAGALGRAVDDDDVGGPAAGQRRGGEGSHRAGAHHDRPAAEDLADPVERGRHEGRRELVDGRLGVHALADAEGLLEQHVEGRADRPGLLTAGQRLARLAEDLALADRHRVEPGRHLEQVRDRTVVVVDVEVRQQVLGGPARPLDQQPGELLDAAVEAVDVGVDLQAVAGRDHRGLGDVLAGRDVAEQLGRTLAVDGHPLEHRDRGGAVGDTDDEDAHAVAPWALRCSWYARICSSIERSTLRTSTRRARRARWARS